VVVGDFNADGHIDIATGTQNVNSLLLFPGRGDGTFQDPILTNPSGRTNALAAGDFDGDGTLDLAVGLRYNYGDPGWVDIMLGTGDGHFVFSARYGTGITTTHAVTGDLDLDGDLDLAMADFESRSISLFLGNGDGTMTPMPPLDSGSGPSTISMGDLDLDGFPDLVLAVRYDDRVEVFRGRGDGTFDPAVPYDARGYAVEIAEINGDGLPDVVAVGDGEVVVLLGTGSMLFGPVTRYLAGSYTRALAIADLDNDSLDDVAVARSGRNVVSVLLNRLNAPRLVAGPGPAEANNPLVRIFSPVAGVPHRGEFMAYAAPHWGVNVSCGDPDGDGLDEILTGPGPGEIYGPHVRGFDVHGRQLPGLGFLAYGTLKYGVNVAAGDLDGDGFDEIITGAGPGAVFGPHVRGFDYDGSPPVIPMAGVSFLAYGTPKWGVNVSCGDIDGDGYDEIVTGAGPGAVYGPHVRGWNVDGGTAVAVSGVSFFAYGTPKWGVNVSCGDLDGDGIDEIVTGAGPGAVYGPHVRGWNVDGGTATPMTGCSFFAWPPESLRYGARVFAGADLDGDGRDDLLVGPGPDPAAGTLLNLYRYESGAVVPWFTDLETFPGLTHGTAVAAGRF
jgi:hypothetical protein